jgi:hypothetical protein
MQNQTGHPMVVGSSGPTFIPFKGLNMILSSSLVNGIYYY